MDGYHNIKVKFGGVTVGELRKLKITNRFNEHAVVSLTMLIPEEEVEDWLAASDFESPFEVNRESGSTETLFRGKIVDLQLRVEQNIHYLDIEGIAFTGELDVKRKNRVFQDDNLNFKELVKIVLSEYEGIALFGDTELEGQKVGPFIVQYQETDWEFLLRIASRFQVGILTVATAEKIQIHLGLPSKKPAELSDIPYQVQKKLACYRWMARNESQDLSEDDYLDFEIKTDRFLNIGDSVHHEKRRLFVSQSIISLDQGILNHFYHLAPEKGLKQKPRLNQQLKGLSLIGKVVERQQDRVRVALEIGGIQPKERSYWFTYATAYVTEGNTGCYCMPEIGDTVLLNFPTAQEETAVVICALHQGSGEQMQKPEVKYYRTAYSKELKFQQDELSLSGIGAKLKISLNDQTGVVITSEGQIEIKAKQDLTLDAKGKIHITSGEGIDLKCRDGVIALNDIIRIQDTQIDKEPGVSL